MVEENLNNYNEDEANYSVTCRLETAFGRIGKLCDYIDVFKAKQSDMCKRNVIFCHVDCLFTGEKMKPEVFCAPNTSATVSALKNNLLCTRNMLH